MSRSNSRRFFRDNRRRWLGGVCSGLANYLGLPIFIVRTLTILAMLSPLLPLIVIAYIIMVFSIPLEPGDLYSSPEARTFYQTAHREPATTIGQVGHQLRVLEHRIQSIEAYVTSTEFEFNHEIRERGR